MRVAPASVEVCLGRGAPGREQVLGLSQALRTAAAQGSGVLVLPDDLVAHASVLDDLRAAPATSAVVDAATTPTQGVAVVVAAGLVVGARRPGEEPHAGEWMAPGALWVDGADAAAVADHLDAVVAAGTTGPAGAWIDVVTLAVVRSGVRVAALVPAPLVVVRPPGAAGNPTGAEALAGDERALRLRWSSRADDGFASTFVVRPVSRRVTAVALRLGIPPAPITAAAFALGLGAAACFAAGTRGWLLLGAALLLGSLVVDCVDGEVARFTRRTTPLGGWADVLADRVKEVAVYAGLAAGLAGQGRDLWGVAALALAVQLVRHQVDYSFWVGQRCALAPVPVPVDPAWAGPMPPGADAPVGAVAALSARTSALTWAKRVLVLPVGERLLLISVLAAAGRPGLALVVLAGWGLVSLVYMAAGRVGRMLAWPPRVGDDPAVRRGWELLADAGPVLRPVRPLSRPAGPRGAVVPPVLLAVAVTAVLMATAAWSPTSWPATYAVLGAVALRGYDLATRERLRRSGRSPLAPLALGVEGRAAVAVLACGVVAPAWREWVLVVLATWVVVVTVVESVDSWRRPSGGPV